MIYYDDMASFRKEYDHRKPKNILTRLQSVREILEGRA